jgi:hypothetical protein
MDVGLIPNKAVRVGNPGVVFSLNASTTLGKLWLDLAR